MNQRVEIITRLNYYGFIPVATRKTIGVYFMRSSVHDMQNDFYLVTHINLEKEILCHIFCRDCMDN